MQKNKILQWTPLFVIFLFFLPYIGELGKAVFFPVGKYYYIILAVVGVAEVVLRWRYLHREASFSDFLRWALRQFLIPCGIVAVVMAVSYLFFENTVDNCVFGVVIAFFFCYFCSIDASDTFLFRLGVGSMICMGVMAAVTLLEKKATYFNPNSYAFISCALFLFASLFFYTRKTSFLRQPLFWVTLAAAIVLISPVYRCETQLISVVFYVGCMLILPVVLRHKWRFVTFTGAIFAFTLLLPLISYILIDWGILTTDFITRRGERWWDTVEALKVSGLFRIVHENIGPHNGFLDMATKYGIVPSLIAYCGLFAAVVRSYPIVKQNKYDQTLYCMLMSFLLMNSVESFFVGLTDCYYMLLALALLMTRQRVWKQKTLQAGE